jgi:hypothetical protein
MILHELRSVDCRHIKGMIMPGLSEVRVKPLCFAFSTRARIRRRRPSLLQRWS